MAWIPMYLLEPDVTLLNNWLNEEEEIAFLVSNGNKKWIAKKEYDISKAIGQQTKGFFNFKIDNFAEFNLWHIPSGPLPLVTRNGQGVPLRLHKKDWEIKNVVLDPWEGWTEKVTGAASNVPYFENHPGIINLEINLAPFGPIPMSMFGWIGNHYSILGNKAQPVTEIFWKKLRRYIKKVSTHIPRSNKSGGKNEIYAFPNAYNEIVKGRACRENP